MNREKCFPFGTMEFCTHEAFCTYHRIFRFRKGLNDEVIVGRFTLCLNWALGLQFRGIGHETPNKSGKRFINKLNHKLFKDLPNTTNLLNYCSNK